MRSRARRIWWALVDRCLTFEQWLGMLGPAHRLWRGHSAGENQAKWDGWDWTAKGEEWNASLEWKQSLVEDVLNRWVAPGGVVLEVGPGAGRWTEHLAALASRLVIVDVSERALELCRERFSHEAKLEYVLSSGTDFPGVRSGSVDAVWSFDVFVHIAPKDQAAYLEQIARVLTAGGVAVIHHSDGRNRGSSPSRIGWRSPMSRRLFAALARQRGFHIEAQFDSWGPDRRHGLSGFADAITVLRRDGRPVAGDSG